MLAGDQLSPVCSPTSSTVPGYNKRLRHSAGLPITFALTNPKDDERVVARDMLEIEPGLLDQRFLKPLRQISESINQTLKAQLDLERHGGRKLEGVAARVLERLLALTAAIWHNEQTGRPVRRSLIAYDH